MNGVILDAESLGPGVNLGPITDQLDHWSTFTHTLKDEILDRVGRADVVLTNKVALTRDLIDHAKHLKHISVMATGTNNIDLAAATEKANKRIWISGMLPCRMPSQTYNAG